MAWQELSIPKSEIDLVLKTHRKKAKFLADENFNPSIVEYLQSKGWNIKNVHQLQLNGKADETVYAAAYKEKRILLTHDSDFLIHRRFPFNRGWGVFIFPDGNEDIISLFSCILTMLQYFAPHGEFYKQTKVIFGKDGELKMIGSSWKHNYKINHGKVYEWF